MVILLTLPEVLAVTGLSRVRIWGRIQAGTFPKSINLSDKPKALWFRQDQIKKWCREHAAWKRACAKRARPSRRVEL